MVDGKDPPPREGAEGDEMVTYCDHVVVTRPPPSARLAAQISNWVQDRLRARVLGAVLEILAGHNQRITTVEERMGAVSDTLRAFRAQVDAESSRIGERIASLTARLDAGENVAAAEINAELSGVVDTLRAMGTGAAADPLPDPDPGDNEGGSVPV